MGYEQNVFRPASEFPFAPANVQVIHGFDKGVVDIRWDDPSVISIVNTTQRWDNPIYSASESIGGQNNGDWEIVGVNIYRSTNGERGTYKRLNQYPIGSGMFRDRTDNVFVNRELIYWDEDWHTRGDKANLSSWIIQVKNFPMVKKEGSAIHANSTFDVAVYIDGVRVQVDRVVGTTGHITLIDAPCYDIAREKNIQPILPSSTSVVEVSYYHNINLIDTTLDKKDKVFYRVTTVAKSNSTPSGLIETPLSYAPPVSLMEVETLDYIWREALRRNNWILEQGGERVKLFVRKRTGLKCNCTLDEQLVEYSKQPSARCQRCFGTGIVGGYEGPYDIIVCPDDGERVVSQSDRGRRKEHTYDCWIGNTPTVSQRDFIVKQDGERYSIGSVRRPSNRGNQLNQFFSIGYLDESDIRYQVPVTGVSELSYPETRTTENRTRTVIDHTTWTTVTETAPYPVGSDYQAAPMVSEKEEISDNQEQRGRTPVWENQNY
jgi:predicted RNA-binding Zn-ribbon protein involved in translation (DUF1610 family)